LFSNGGQYKTGDFFSRTRVGPSPHRRHRHQRGAGWALYPLGLLGHRHRLPRADCWKKEHDRTAAQRRPQRASAGDGRANMTFAGRTASISFYAPYVISGRPETGRGFTRLNAPRLPAPAGKIIIPQPLPQQAQPAGSLARKDTSAPFNPLSRLQIDIRVCPRSGGGET